MTPTPHKCSPMFDISTGGGQKKPFLDSNSIRSWIFDSRMSSSWIRFCPNRIFVPILLRLSASASVTPASVAFIAKPRCLCFGKRLFLLGTHPKRISHVFFWKVFFTQLSTLTMPVKTRQFFCLIFLPISIILLNTTLWLLSVNSTSSPKNMPTRQILWSLLIQFVVCKKGGGRWQIGCGVPLILPKECGSQASTNGVCVFQSTLFWPTWFPLVFPPLPTELRCRTILCIFLDAFAH